MEQDFNYNKVGAGILTISILHFIGCVITFFSVIINIVFADNIKDTLVTAGMGDLTPQTSTLAITLVSAILLAIFVTLILLKKVIGVYGYFAINIFSIIYSLISAGFSFFIIFSFILPILMLIFIMKKKHLYGFGDKN